MSSPIRTPYSPVSAVRGPSGAALRAEVLVVGAGLIGAAATLALAQAGLQVGWIAPAGAADSAAAGPALGPAAGPAAGPAVGQDGSPDAPWDSRIYAVSPGNIDWLSAIGAWDGVAPERTCDVVSMQINGDDGEASLSFDTRIARQARLAVICESSNLARGIERALAAAGDRVMRVSGRVAELRVGERAVSIALESGASLRAPLVVAADGADSSIRQLAGIEAKTRGYQHTAVVANFRSELAHHGTARQWFFGDSVLALLPLPGDHCSLVWSCADAHASFLLELPGAMLAAEVQRVTAGVTGALDPVTAAQGFALRLQQVDKLVVPRIALIGDAAHVVHPLAGQGMNLGLGDCRELARVLAGRGPQTDVGDLGLLRRYQRARAEPIATLRMATDGLFRLFASDRAGVARLRNLGLGWVDRSAMLKRQLIAAAIV